MRDVRGRVARVVEGSGGRLGSLAATAEATWADRRSRWLVIVAGASLWFAAALQEAALLVLVVVSVAGVWWRRRRRKLEPVVEDVDDWY